MSDQISGFATSTPVLAVIAKATGARLHPVYGEREMLFSFPTLPADFAERVVNDEVPPLQAGAYVAAHEAVYTLIAQFRQQRSRGRS